MQPEAIVNTISRSVTTSGRIVRHTSCQLAQDKGRFHVIALSLPSQALKTLGSNCCTSWGEPM